MMDFGLDKLIELIEERFGRLAGTVVLAAIGIGAFSFAVYAFLNYLIVPLLRFVPPTRSVQGTADFLYGAMTVLFGLAAALVFLVVAAVIQRRIQREILGDMADVQEIIRDCKAFISNSHTKIQREMKQLEELQTKVLAEMDIAAAEIEKLKKRPGV